MSGGSYGQSQIQGVFRRPINKSEGVVGVGSLILHDVYVNERLLITASTSRRIVFNDTLLTRAFLSTF